MIVKAIPYKSFKEKIKITRNYKKAKIIIYENHIYVEYKNEDEKEQ